MSSNQNTADREIMISVRGLGKAYNITRADAPQHNTLAETVIARVRRPLYRPQQETFWALRDVSFDVRRGDVVGVIGRNGAGKSTLFKVLSRITEPTTGTIDLYGRVGSLLEVGTGFSGELTGRENIFLNGTILGMRRSEITKRFDEIVDFAGVERFLDTPVKRYSSGMYVRLAFAVAAHLDTEILIVDEVLAVGDSEFQNKCLGKIREVTDHGRTVLFVSHNMAAIQRLCTTAIVLTSGRVMSHGAVGAAISIYNQMTHTSNEDLGSRINRRGTGSAKFIEARTCLSDGNSSTTIPSGSGLLVRLVIESTKDYEVAVPGANIHDQFGNYVAVLWEGFTRRQSTLKRGENRFEVFVPRIDLVPARYSITLTLASMVEVMDVVEDAIQFEIANPTRWNPLSTPKPGEHGVLFPEFTWSQT